MVKKKTRSGLIFVFLGFFALLVMGGTYLLGPGDWKVKDGQVYAPYELRHPEATGETFSWEGGEETYYEPEYGFMAEATDPSAPFSTPQVKARTVEPAQCSDQALGQVIPAPGSWVVPSLSDGAGGMATGYFSTGAFSAGFPSAPAGLLSSLSAPLGTVGKASVLAGHVNMDYPNDRLSAWGLLHYIDPCAHVYITDEAGVTREYQVTVIDTIKQGATETDPGLWGSAETSPEEWAEYGAEELVWLLTCSGAFVGDSGAGNTFLFPYTDNLRVGLVPLTTESEKIG